MIGAANFAGDHDEVFKLAGDLKMARLSSEHDSKSTTFYTTSQPNSRLERRLCELEKRVTKVAITQEGLIKELGMRVTEDMDMSEVTMLDGHPLSSLPAVAFQNGAAWVYNNSEFRGWLLSRRSHMLCIQGHGELEKTSPLSSLVWFLYKKLEEMPHTLVLPFFCGLSTVRSGPVSLVRGLFAQLLSLCQDQGHRSERQQSLFSFLERQDKAKVEKPSFAIYKAELTKLMKDLRKQYSSMFVLIDAVDFYDLDWEDEMNDFVKSMRKLVKLFDQPADGTPGSDLRILMTASTWSRRFSSPPRSMVVLDVPEDVDKY